MYLITQTRYKSALLRSRLTKNVEKHVWNNVIITIWIYFCGWALFSPSENIHLVLLLKTFFGKMGLFYTAIVK